MLPAARLGFPFPALDSATSPESGWLLGDSVWVLIPGGGAGVHGRPPVTDRACLGGPPGPRSCLASLLTGAGGHVCPRPPALLADLQGRHLQGSQHRSERDERGTQTRVRWAHARDSGASEPLSGQVATVRTAVLGTRPLLGESQSRRQAFSSQGQNRDPGRRAGTLLLRRPSCSTDRCRVLTLYS